VTTISKARQHNQQFKTTTATLSQFTVVLQSSYFCHGCLWRQEFLCQKFISNFFFLLYSLCLSRESSNLFSERIFMSLSDDLLAVPR